MKKSFVGAALALMALAIAPTAHAAIGWAGNVFPNSGSSHTPTGDITVYAQVYKGGTTDSAGQGADITAELRYSTDIDATVKTVAMSYLGDVGNNDEYTANIPQADLAGAATVSSTIVFTDLTDSSEFEVTGDQNGNPPPLVYNIVNVTPNDIDVTFTLCMSGTPTNGAPCVIGSAAPIGSWGTGVNMSSLGGDLYEVTVTFPAGSNPQFEYKYRSDGCTNWESVGNRAVTLPTDGSTSLVLDADSFNNAPIGCNLGDTLAEDKQVSFLVCLDGVDTTGPACVIGGHSVIGNWGTGVDMVQTSPEYWEVTVTFPAGSPIPGVVEYKYKKDACATWESVPNRTFTVDNTSDTLQSMENSWDEGPCQAVATEAGSWGQLKHRH